MEKFDLHIHSRYSDGMNSPQEIVEYAQKIGLSGVAITDHDEIEGSLQALKFQGENFQVIPGLEVSSREGHILALGVKEMVEWDNSAQETVEKIHSLGGIAVATHPYDSFRMGVGDLIYRLDFDAVEVENGHTFRNRKNPLKMAQEKNLCMVGGSDAHTLGEIGSVTVLCKDCDILKAIRECQVKINSQVNKIRVLKNTFYRKLTR